MLEEEKPHLGTGNNGLRRIVRRGLIPTEILQRYFNKWLPTACDLLRVNNSSSAHWSCVWGLEGRFDETSNEAPAERESPNE